MYAETVALEAYAYACSLFADHFSICVIPEYI